MKRKSRFWVFVFALLVIGAAHTQNRDTIEYQNIPGKHSGAVTALLRDSNGQIISAGEDGFLEIWNDSAAEGRFQVSRYAIKLMAARPGRPEAAIVESDGFSLNSVSAWNYETKKRLFTLRFGDSVSCINYSAAGNFLIVSRSGGTVLLDPETGEVLKSPELPPSASLALTGPSERTIVFYQPSGVLSYWNLETENETQRFYVPPDIQNPVLFGNNCFLAGFDSGGLLVLDAVTGLVLAREPVIRQGDIFTENTESASFYCVSGNGRSCTIYILEINLSAFLTTIERRVFFIGEVSHGISAGEDKIVLGTRLGDLWLVGEDETRVLETRNQEVILDIAVSSSGIALLCENGTIVYIPLDYSTLEEGSTLIAEARSGNQVYPGVPDARVYRGESGAVYVTVINQADGKVTTSIVVLDLSNLAESETIVEYDGEDPFIVIAESGGNLATTLGTGMAVLYMNPGTTPGQAEREAVPFEGDTAFPVKIIDGGRFFVALDGEGTVSWHDNMTGKSLAVFRLYREFWTLEKTALPGADRETLRGINARPTR
jgi:hypothetical protein